MAQKTEPVNLASATESEYQELDARLEAEHPGVQAVMEVYELTQVAGDEFDQFVRAVNVVPVTLTSNGSAF